MGNKAETETEGQHTMAWHMCAALLSFAIPFIIWRRHREVCNMQNATCPSQGTSLYPLLPFPLPLPHCRHCCSLCCAVHLLQTLILFMLQCSEVNNFIYPLPEARTMRASLQLHSLVAGCLPLKLQLRMTHDTCLGCEKLFHLLPCQDLLKAMASSADWIVPQRRRRKRDK